MSKYEICKGNDKGEECWRWRLIDDNGEIIAHSEEAFSSRDSVVTSVKKLKNYAPDAPIFEDESSEDTDRGNRFEHSQSEKDGQWYWKFRAGNHEPMGIGEGYSSKSAVKDALENIRTEMGRAVITYENPDDDPAAGAKNTDTTKTKGAAGS